MLWLSPAASGRSGHGNLRHLGWINILSRLTGLRGIEVCTGSRIGLDVRRSVCCDESGDLPMSHLTPGSMNGSSRVVGGVGRCRLGLTGRRHWCRESSRLLKKYEVGVWLINLVYELGLLMLRLLRVVV